MCRITSITHVDRVSNTDLLERQLYNTTILDSVHVQQLRWLGHVQRMSKDQLPKIAFERVHGSRPRGRPPKRWKEKFFHYNLLDLLRMAQYREQYRKHIHSLVRREAPRRPKRPGGTSAKSSKSQASKFDSFYVTTINNTLFTEFW